MLVEEIMLGGIWDGRTPKEVLFRTGTSKVGALGLKNGELVHALIPYSPPGTGLESLLAS